MKNEIFSALQEALGSGSQSQRISGSTIDYQICLDDLTMDWHVNATASLMRFVGSLVGRRVKSAHLERLPNAEKTYIVRLVVEFEK